MNGAWPGNDSGAPGVMMRVSRLASVRIGKQKRHCVLRARLDAQMPPPAGHAEQQDDVGLLRHEFRQIAIDRRIGRGKDMRVDLDAVECRSPPAHERFHQ